MKRLFAALILAALILSLCACGGTEGVPELPKGDSSLPTGGIFGGKDDFEELSNLDIFRDTFGKEITCYHDSLNYMGYYWSESLAMGEIRAVDFKGCLYLYRMAKADTWQDITADLDIKWDTLSPDSTPLLTGKSGTGTLKYKSPTDDKKTEYPFSGSIWFDEVDGLCYAIIAAGEGADSPSPHDCFRPHQNFDLSAITDYRQAQEFLSTHTFLTDTFYFVSYPDGSSQFVEHRPEEENCIIVNQTSADGSYHSRFLYPDGGSWYYSETRDPATGETSVETSDRDGSVSKYRYISPDIMLENRFFAPDGTLLSHQICDGSGNVTYSYDVQPDRTREIWYEGNGGRKVDHITSDPAMPEGYDSACTFKTITVDGQTRRYYLTVENPFASKIYTYASADSPYLVRYECTSHYFGYHVIWTMDGGGIDAAAHALSLQLTQNGATTNYTAPDFPWGDGIEFPPKNPGDFYF